MPDPPRSGLAAAPGRLLFSEVTGRYAQRWLDTCGTVAAGRLPLLMLGPIITAYEQAMTEGEGKNTLAHRPLEPLPVPGSRNLPDLPRQHRLPVVHH